MRYSEQCERQGYKLNNADKWDDLVHCTIMLYIHNILTDSRYDECLSRILKKYKKDLQNGFIYTKHALDVFNEIAEQLKAGIENDT